MQERSIVQLHGRGIHGDHRVGGKRRHLPACGPQHPLTNGGDEPDLFSDGNEYRGWDHAEGRMAPSQERLEADELPRLHGQLRLIVNLELASEECFAKVCGERMTRPDTFFHRNLEELETSSSRCVRAVKRDAGPIEEQFSLQAMLWAENDPDIRAKVHQLATDCVGPLQKLDDSSCDETGFFSACAGLNQNDELIVGYADHA